MDEFIEKIPNWLRYILAIPFGIICSILVYYVGYFSNLWIAAPGSLMMRFYDYIYSNVLNILVFMITMSYMLPRHQFKFTLTISIIFCSLALIVIGMAIILETITLQEFIGIVLSILASVWSCYYIFKEFKDNYNVVKEDKYAKLYNIVIKGLGVNDIDEAISKTYEFYKEQGFELDDIKLDSKDKYKTLSNIIMLALGTSNIDEAIKLTTTFYEGSNV